MLIILIFLGFGAIAGLLAGLLGIGGGVILVPVLYYTLQFLGFPEADLMHIAVATSLTSTVITTTGSSLSHYHKKSIHWKTVKSIFVGLAIGSMGGALLASDLEGDWLRYIFGIALLPFSLYFFSPHLSIPIIAPRPNWTLNIWSVAIGTFASLLGIGGGVFMVPLLLSHDLPIKNAIGTSSVATFISALVGSITFFLLSFREPHLQGTFGNIAVTAFLALGFSSLLAAPFGAKLAHIFPTDLTKRIFACALAASGLSMLFGI